MKEYLLTQTDISKNNNKSNITLGIWKKLNLLWKWWFENSKWISILSMSSSEERLKNWYLIWSDIYNTYSEIKWLLCKLLIIINADILYLCLLVLLNFSELNGFWVTFQQIWFNFEEDFLSGHIASTFVCSHRDWNIKFIGILSVSHSTLIVVSYNSTNFFQRSSLSSPLRKKILHAREKSVFVQRTRRTIKLSAFVWSLL